MRTRDPEPSGRPPYWRSGDQIWWRYRWEGDRHVRDDRNVYTSDRVLDLDVDPDGTSRRKDEDELVLAVEQGRYSPAEAERLHRDLEDAEAVVRAWGSPFCDGWDTYRPEPAWPPPALPA